MRCWCLFLAVSFRYRSTIHTRQLSIIACFKKTANKQEISYLIFLNKDKNSYLLRLVKCFSCWLVTFLSFSVHVYWLCLPPLKLKNKFKQISCRVLESPWDLQLAAYYSHYKFNHSNNWEQSVIINQSFHLYPKISCFRLIGLV